MPSYCTGPASFRPRAGTLRHARWPRVLAACVLAVALASAVRAGADPRAGTAGTGEVGRVPCDASGAAGSPYAVGVNCRTIAIDGYPREYLVYVPPARPSNEKAPAPVVLVLHGGSQTGERFLRMSRWREKANEVELIAVFPTALRHYLSADGRWARQWHDYYLPVEADLARRPAGYPATAPWPADDVGLVRAILDDLERMAHVDSGRMYATGFSNGAAFTYRLAIEATDRLAAFAWVGGRFCDAVHADWTGSPPRAAYMVAGAVDSMLMGHIGVGDALPLDVDSLLDLDPLVECLKAPLDAFELAREPYATREPAGGGHIEWSTSRIASRSNSLRFAVLEGLGHRYPNGDNNPLGWVAADRFWEFFRDFRLPAPRSTGDAASEGSRDGRQAAVPPLHATRVAVMSRVDTARGRNAGKRHRAARGSGPAGPPLETVIVRFRGVERPVSVYVPSGYRNGTPVPLVFALHGGSGNASVMYDPDKRIVQHAESQRFIAVFPNGLPRPGARARRGNFFWSDPANVPYMSHLMDLMSETYAVDAERIYFVGFSGGAQLIYKLAADRTASERIAAIATVAGGIGQKPADPDAPWEIIELGDGDGTPMSALLLQGGRDTRMPAQGGFSQDLDKIVLSFATKVDLWRLFAGATHRSEGVTLPLAPRRVAATRHFNPPAGRTVLAAVDPNLPHKWPEWDFMGAAWDFFGRVPVRERGGPSPLTTSNQRKIEENPR